MTEHQGCVIAAASTTENICDPSPESVTLDPGDALVLHSPGYPHNYEPDLDCHWTVTTSSGHDMQVTNLYHS